MCVCGRGSGCMRACVSACQYCMCVHVQNGAYTYVYIHYGDRVGSGTGD